MPTVFVVPREPDRQVPTEFGAGFVAFEINPFVLQGAPESLDEDVVLEPALTVHADPDIPGL